jgi:predicted PhzF superfamily epimerase YddE/YHI9
VSAEDHAELTRFLGVTAGDVLDAQWVDNGPGWVGLLLRDAATVLAARPTPPCRLRDVGIVGAYPPGAECDVEVRALITVGGSLAEDPVTGSLNASLAQWLIGAGRLPSAYVAAQGTVLGRRGRVHVQAEGSQVWVGGPVTPGVSGTIAL